MCIYKSLIHHPLPMMINQENAGAGIVVPTYNRSYWEAPSTGGLALGWHMPFAGVRGWGLVTQAEGWTHWPLTEVNYLSTSQRSQAGCQRTWKKGDSGDLRLDPRKSVSLRTKDCIC